VSSQNPNKNFSAVAEALKLLGTDAPPCVIVGQPRSDIFAGGLHGSPTLRFCGYVSDDALKALLDNALCLIYPSFYEGFGLPPLEAMARGCPVISSSTSALPETCGGAAMYCDPADPASLADAIKKVAKDAALRASMSLTGRERAATYRWSETAGCVKRAIESRL
jgi:glycosyltransferase involved in cell wall biosynthesis